MNFEILFFALTKVIYPLKYRKSWPPRSNSGPEVGKENDPVFWWRPTGKLFFFYVVFHN